MMDIKINIEITIRHLVDVTKNTRDSTNVNITDNYMNILQISILYTKADITHYKINIIDIIMNIIKVNIIDYKTDIRY